MQTLPPTQSLLPLPPTPATVREASAALPEAHTSHTLTSFAVEKSPDTPDFPFSNPLPVVEVAMPTQLGHTADARRLLKPAFWLFSEWKKPVGLAGGLFAAAVLYLLSRPRDVRKPHVMGVHAFGVQATTFVAPPADVLPFVVVHNGIGLVPFDILSLAERRGPPGPPLPPPGLEVAEFQLEGDGDTDADSSPRVAASPEVNIDESQPPPATYPATTSTPTTPSSSGHSTPTVTQPAPPVDLIPSEEPADPPIVDDRLRIPAPTPGKEGMGEEQGVPAMTPRVETKGNGAGEVKTNAGVEKRVIPRPSTRVPLGPRNGRVRRMVQALELKGTKPAPAGAGPSRLRTTAEPPARNDGVPVLGRKEPIQLAPVRGGKGKGKMVF